ncbi:hypothetical protein M9H77_18905 [Catharanthus roseus]|uniref:Uncharacterized protein n=1 Tax=Catharanthus roseus TaxID=4058 RepID=A0ACC0B8X2_CATRO|nr:hypothetical protein M9H77_18905 [Catharanthus roseus]
MISKSKLIRMARKWQRKVTITRKRITFPINNGNVSTNGCSSSSPVAEKGHLLRMAEEEFGLPSDGPITIPCEAAFMDYLISLIPGCTSKDIEKAVFLSISAYRCSSMVNQLEKSNYSLVRCV